MPRHLSYRELRMERHREQSSWRISQDGIGEQRSISPPRARGGYYRDGDEDYGGSGQDGMLYELKEKYTLTKTQLESKTALLEEQKDEISALKQHCDTLTRTLRSKDEEAELLQQAMERMNAAHMQAHNGMTAAELAEEVSRLEAMLKTSHSQGKHLYQDYKKLLEDYEDKERQLVEACAVLDQLQKERGELLKNTTHHHTHFQLHPTSASTPVPQPSDPPERYIQGESTALANENKQRNPSASSMVLTFSPPRDGPISGVAKKPVLSRSRSRKNGKDDRGDEVSSDTEVSLRPTDSNKRAEKELRRLRKELNAALQRADDAHNKLHEVDAQNQQLQRAHQEALQQLRERQDGRPSPQPQPQWAPDGQQSQTVQVTPGQLQGSPGVMNLANIRAMESENMLLTEEIRKLRQKNKDLEDALDANSPSNSRTTSPSNVYPPEAVARDLAQFQKRVAELEAQLDDRDRERRAMQLELDKKEAENASLAASQAALSATPSGKDKDVSALLERNRQLLEELEAVRRHLGPSAESSARLVEAEKDIERLEKDRQTYEQDRQALVDEIVRLRGLLNLTVAPDEVEKLKATIEQLKTDLESIDELKDENEYFKRMIENFNKSNGKEKHIKDIEKLCEAVNHYQAEVEKMKKDLRSGDSKVAKHVKQMVNDLDDRLERLHGDCIELRAQALRTDDGAPDLTEDDKVMLSNETRKLTDQVSELQYGVSQVRSRLKNSTRIDSDLLETTLSSLRGITARTGIVQEEVSYLKGVLSDQCNDGTAGLLQQLKYQIDSLQREMAENTQKNEAGLERERRRVEDLMKQNDELRQALTERRLQDSRQHEQALQDAEQRAAELQQDVEYLRQQLCTEAAQAAQAARRAADAEHRAALAAGGEHRAAADARRAALHAASCALRIARPASLRNLAATAWNALRLHAVRCKLRRSLCMRLRASALRVVASRRYHAWYRYTLLRRGRRGGSHHLADTLLAMTTKGSARRAFRKLKDYMFLKKRDADNVHWLTVLWQTKSQAAASSRRILLHGIARTYFNKWHRYAVRSARLRARRTALELLCASTARGLMRNAYTRLLHYATLRSTQRHQRAVKHRTAAALAAHSNALRRAAAFRTLCEYAASRREEGFYWRQRGATTRAANCLLSLSTRRLLARYYAKLRAYASHHGRQAYMAAHCMQVATLKGLLRVYYSKLAAYRQRRATSQSKHLIARALLTSTQKCALLHSFVPLLANAVRGRRRHVRVINTAAMFPLRIVTGGPPQSVYPSDSRSRSTSRSRTSREHQRASGSPYTMMSGHRGRTRLDVTQPQLY